MDMLSADHGLKVENPPINLADEQITYAYQFLGVITFSSHQLPAIVNMPPWTDTSTKREYPTTIFTYFGPFSQSDLLTRTVKGPCAPHVPTKPISFPFFPQPQLFNESEQKKKSKEELEASSRHFRISHFNSKQQEFLRCRRKEQQCRVHWRAKLHLGSPCADVEYLHLWRLP
jgi:hypothetical protein